MQNTKKPKFLGKKSPLPESPELAKLDSIDKPFSNLNYSIRLSAPEFTTLCPITSQPDFGQIIPLLS